MAESIAELRHPPKLVMADSQVIMDVAAQTPEDIPLTTFSIQMAYSKADVIEMARGTAALASLEDGDRVLICETSSHHPQKDDIGRIKIHRWHRQKTGKDLQIEVAVGKDFPVELTHYKVLIQCGGCVGTRRHMLMRLRAAHAQNVPMTNYGLTISYLQGVLEREIERGGDVLLVAHNGPLSTAMSILMDMPDTAVNRLWFEQGTWSCVEIDHGVARLKYFNK